MRATADGLTKLELIPSSTGDHEWNEQTNKLESINSSMEDHDVQLQVLNERTPQQRNAYKVSTVKAFKIHTYPARKRVPHSSTLVEHKRKYSGYFEVHLLLPERLHDRLFMKRICGSKRVAEEVAATYTVQYLIDFWVMLTLSIIPALAVAVLGYTMSIEESVPSWLPYIGAFFYIVGVPTLLIATVLEEDSYKLVLNVDSKALKYTMIVASLLCFVCSPVYGIWAVANLSENPAVDENMGLYVGAYIGFALYLPLWVVVAAFLVFFLDHGSRSDKFILGISILIFVMITAVLIGSIVHQAVVGELVWFPYIGAIGLFFTVPLFSFVIVVGVVMASVEQFLLSENIENIGILFSFLLFMTVTDVFAWMLAERNLNLPFDQLIEDKLLYSGAVVFYISSIICWLLALGFSIGYI